MEGLVRFRVGRSLQDIFRNRPTNPKTAIVLGLPTLSPMPRLHCANIIVQIWGKNVVRRASVLNVGP